MFTISESFKGQHEDYITLPAIKTFIKDNKLSSTSKSREELLNIIEQYARENYSNQEYVMNWIDTVLQEGIREIHLYHFQIKPETKIVLSKKDSAQKHINNFVDKTSNGHICGNNYTDQFTLVKASAIETSNDIKLTFMFCKKIINFESKLDRKKIVEYPVIAEYYVNSEWLLIKAKPKSNLFKYVDDFKLESAEPVRYEKQIDEIRDYIKNKLDFVQFDRHAVENNLKRKVFELLDKFTYTPEPIKNIIDDNKSHIERISEEIMAIANLPKAQFDDINSDICNIVEKYISIYWKKKDDFIKDREAYPVRLCATDDEESKVEQEAALSEPLQTKAIFFDNKKMLYKNKKCDGVHFCWKRKDKGYFKEYFNVYFKIHKGRCSIKFPEYTEMEDIYNVLFSVIDIKQ